MSDAYEDDPAFLERLADQVAVNAEHTSDEDAALLDRAVRAGMDALVASGAPLEELRFVLQVLCGAIVVQSPPALRDDLHGIVRRSASLWPDLDWTMP